MTASLQGRTNPSERSTVKQRDVDSGSSASCRCPGTCGVTPPAMSAATAFPFASWPTTVSPLRLTPGFLPSSEQLA